MAFFLKGRDQDIVPPVCYDVCNNAYLEAQKIGKKPQLCEEGSTFQRLISSCNRCIDENIVSVEATKMLLQPKFSQFIDFCLVQDPGFDTAPATQTISQATESQPQTVIVQTVTFTLPGGQVTHGTATTTLDTLDRGPFQNSTSVSSPSAPPSETSSTNPSATPSTTPLSSSPNSTSPPPTPTATIAGATVGGALGLISILGLIIFYMRRNKKRNKQNIESQTHEIDGQQRLQLHGDSIQPKELSTQANTAEMEGNYEIYYEDPSKPGYFIPLQGEQIHPVELYGSEIQQVAPQSNDAVHPSN